MVPPTTSTITTPILVDQEGILSPWPGRSSQITGLQYSWQERSQTSNFLVSSDRNSCGHNSFHFHSEPAFFSILADVDPRDMPINMDHCYRKVSTQGHAIHWTPFCQFLKYHHHHRHHNCWHCQGSATDSKTSVGHLWSSASYSRGEPSGFHLKYSCS